MEVCFMSKLKRFVVLFLSLFILVGTMSGCAELVSSETITVNAEISNTYHSGFYQTTMKIGNTTTYITHPESWATYIIYEDKEYVIGTKEIYDLCKDRNGETVQATFIVKTYDNGTVIYNLTDVE